MLGIYLGFVIWDLEFEVYPTINPKKCNGCGNCADICPSEVYVMEGDQSSPIRPEDCIECWACVSQCPVEAIDLQEA